MSLSQFAPVAAWIVSFSVVMFVGTLLLIPVVIIRIPADYFTRRTLPKPGWPTRRPIVAIALKVAKNCAGLLIALAGVIMLFTPGQGILAILFGVSLLDFPGKKRLENRLIRRPVVLNTINAIRARAGQEPLEIPPAKTRTRK